MQLRSEYVTQKQMLLRNCTFVKTVLMILVVGGHALDFWTGDWFTRNPAIPSPFCDLLSRWLNSFHTYAFVLVSGYLFRYLKYERITDSCGYNRLISFVWSKCKRLLVPYTFVSVIWIIPVSIFFFHFELKDIILNFCLALGPGQLWFLWMLFDVFISFFILCRYFDKFTLIGGITVVLIYFIGIYGNSFVPNVFQIWRAAQYFHLFWLGFEIRKWNLPIASTEVAICSSIVFNILFSVIYAMGLVLKGTTEYYLCLLLLHISGALMAFSILELIGENCNWQNSRTVMALADNSMTIYLFHQQIIYFVILMRLPILLYH